MRTPVASHGFTKTERTWLNSLREDIQAGTAVQGKNISISSDNKGQVINGECPDCNCGSSLVMVPAIPFPQIHVPQVRVLEIATV